uniref:Uncharacterized protein n=1 Tax=Tetraselmis chuii TaxID=63592 RepID=A0A7S1SVY4_9CHLO|mmetsp:Transcript_31978/g.57264  ORF Transcript_31978/g.57264 Transcript_31978/m.57264 type:complete len:136 (+) Transcript_31978:723-1130(+)
MNKVLVEQPPILRYALLDNSTYLCGHTLKTHVAWPGHKMKTSKGPARVSGSKAVAVVHVNWTGSLAEKKRLLLRAGFWHMCGGIGAEGFEKQLKESRQWFDAERIAARKVGENKPNKSKGRREQKLQTLPSTLAG